MSSREAIEIDGVVQGVGFRPFVWRLARARNLTGTVGNTRSGVRIEVEGSPDMIEDLAGLIGRREGPARGVADLRRRAMAPIGDTEFRILPSSADDAASGMLTPDRAICAACLDELRRPESRRYAHAFITCAECGPRYSIAYATPFDRGHTAMREFPICAACKAEYDDPGDRRFHAQTISCPECGPRLWLENSHADRLAEGREAVAQTVDALQSGRIVALRGLGGFQLLVRADQGEPVAELRRRVLRPHKPFAVMYRGLAEVEQDCWVDASESEWLGSAEAPIVLLRARDDRKLASEVAPGQPRIGAMLPTTGIHALLLDALALPLVVTSGNVSDAAMCTTNVDARSQLVDIADLFLVHDRAIVMAVDDSVVCVHAGSTSVVRAARGLAPLTIARHTPGRPTESAGPDMKNTVTVATHDRWIVSPHIGDLRGTGTRTRLSEVSRHLSNLVDCKAGLLACDTHPDYVSTAWAESAGPRTLHVQHHHAHAVAVMEEHGLEGPVWALCWDGNGHGLDGTVWGGELLRCDRRACERRGRLHRFALIGGDMVHREPQRIALALLHACFGAALVERPVFARWAQPSTRAITHNLMALLAGGSRAPLTSSVGRLFDGVASLLALDRGEQVPSYEGQLAIALEHLAEGGRAHESYATQVTRGTGLRELDWRPMLRSLVTDIEAGVPGPDIALAFHTWLISGACALLDDSEALPVVLAGGCFQNHRLREGLHRQLQTRGWRVYTPKKLPAHDGAVSLGQAVIAAARSC